MSCFINRIWRELTSDDINTVGRTLPHYAGCTSQHRLDTIGWRGKWCVVNLDDESGTHWCGLYDVNPSYTLWVDSYGAPPPLTVRRAMQSTGKACLYNSHELQGWSSEACGYFQLAYMAELLKGRSPTTISLEDYWGPNRVLGCEMNDYCLYAYFVERRWHTLLRLPATGIY